MDTKPFKVGLRIETGKIGQHRVLSTVADAAVFLMDHWPGEKTPERLAAMAACLSALGNEIPAEEAREAIVEAAKASGVFIADDPRPRR